MPLPRSVARFNRRVTNRLLGPLAPYVPGFGVVIHTGRQTQRPYRTPVNVFRRPGGYVIALTYGPNTDWVHNVLASGSCLLETRGQIVRLNQPRLFHDAHLRAVPPPLRLIGRVLGSVAGVSDFLDLSVEPIRARGQ
jgi:deazaflavin-dependent oxidoreductase (nitroreductase family)